MSEPILIPAYWEFDRIHDACAKLAELTGNDFEAAMLAAAVSGELPADGWYGIQSDPAGNLENARHHGLNAAVCWDAVAEWLRARGYDVRRGRWIEFDEALAQLQARVSPAPTAAELESWCNSHLPTFVKADPKWRFEFGNFLFDAQRGLSDQPSERRLDLWLDSEEVEAFAAIAPEHRELTIPQLSERWLVDEPRVWSRLKACSGVVCWPLLDSDPMPYDFVVTLKSVRDIEAENPAWLKFDAFSPDRQLFPWLDLRDRERHDAQRLAELMRLDPAGELGRLRAATALGLPRLSCWLEPHLIATLYDGDTLVAALVEQALFAGLLPARRVCTGVAVHVEDFAHWPGIPPIPDSAAGELARAWLSLDSADQEPDYVPAVASDSADQGMPQSFAAPEPVIQPEPRTELPNPGDGRRTRIIGIKRAVWAACVVLLERNQNCRPSAQDVIEHWDRHGDSEGVVRDIGMDADSKLACAYWIDQRGNSKTASLRAIGDHIGSYLRDRGK